MKKVIFTILDGFGIREEEKGNAVKNASTKAIDKLLKEFSHSELKASGEEVGLPKGQMGNSEVGHITIGSGRIVNQPLQKTDDRERGNDRRHEYFGPQVFHQLTKIRIISGIPFSAGWFPVALRPRRPPFY